MIVDSHEEVAVSHFKQAYNHTIFIEGLYSDNPFDPGGETFLGISRHWHSGWEGWRIIDAYADLDFPESVLADLHDMAERFYRAQFWDMIQGSRIAQISPEIAIKLFDTAVNLSVTDAVKFLQESLNLLNRNTELYPDIVVDGRIGRITINTLERYLVTRPGSPEQNKSRLLKVFGILQGYHYVKEMRKYPTKEVFRGWFDRAI